MNYGIPYMGSKSKIVKELIRIFPKADNFYDLFGGGFSVTHAMVLYRSGHYKNFYFNEIRPGVCELIQDAINGKYSYDNFRPKWVSREEFFKKKEIDPYIKLCWSFGNNGKDYLFSEDIEQYKKAIHQAVVFNEFNDIAEKIFGMSRFQIGTSIKKRRLLLGDRVKFLHPNKKKGSLQQLQQLEHLERLERLEHLERLERLERFEFISRVQFSSLSYEKVEIKDNSIIYCDIPYKKTSKYDKNKHFNHDEFFDWAHNQDNPVFISEYNIDDKRLRLVKTIKKRSIIASKQTNDIRLEKVYINEAGYKKLLSNK